MQRPCRAWCKSYSNFFHVNYSNLSGKGKTFGKAKKQKYALKRVRHSFFFGHLIRLVFVSLFSSFFHKLDVIRSKIRFDILKLLFFLFFTSGFCYNKFILKLLKRIKINLPRQTDSLCVANTFSEVIYVIFSVENT